VISREAPSGIMATSDWMTTQSDAIVSSVDHTPYSTFMPHVRMFVNHAKSVVSSLVLA
jgi:hypothetical protein